MRPTGTMVTALASLSALLSTTHLALARPLDLHGRQDTAGVVQSPGAEGVVQTSAVAGAGGTTQASAGVDPALAPTTSIPLTTVLAASAVAQAPVAGQSSSVVPAAAAAPTVTLVVTAPPLANTTIILAPVTPQTSSTYSTNWSTVMPSGYIAPSLLSSSANASSKTVFAWGRPATPLPPSSTSSSAIAGANNGGATSPNKKLNIAKIAIIAVSVIAGLIVLMQLTRYVLQYLRARNKMLDPEEEGAPLPKAAAAADDESLDDKDTPMTTQSEAFALAEDEHDEEGLPPVDHKPPVEDHVPDYPPEKQDHQAPPSPSETAVQPLRIQSSQSLPMSSNAGALDPTLNVISESDEVEGAEPSPPVSRNRFSSLYDRGSWLPQSLSDPAPLRISRKPSDSFVGTIHETDAFPQTNHRLSYSDPAAIAMHRASNAPTIHTSRRSSIQSMALNIMKAPTKPLSFRSSRAPQ